MTPEEARLLVEKLQADHHRVEAFRVDPWGQRLVTDLAPLASEEMNP